MVAGEAHSSPRRPALGYVGALPIVLCLLLVAVVASMTPFFPAAATTRGQQPSASPLAPDAALAARLFPKADGPLSIVRREDTPSLWTVDAQGAPVGIIASTWEVAQSIGYSGQPIDIAVGITPNAKISGAELRRHNEPILTLGLSTDDIARYVGGFAGFDLTAPGIDAFKDSSRLPPIIAGATVSTGVIRDAILRTARTAAVGIGYIKAAGRAIDRPRHVQ